MHKLLSLMLSVSVLFSSLTPALGQVLGRGMTRGLTTLSKTSSAAFSSQLSREILTKTALASSTLRSVTFYESQLKNTGRSLRVAQSDLPSFLSTASQQPASKDVAAVRTAFNQATAVGLLGTSAQAPILLDFYQQAQGTIFEDLSTLITARGLLRMKAYTELETFLKQNAQKPILNGVAAYIQKCNLPIKIPTTLQQAFPVSADATLASFLGEEFLPSRLHADPSLKATELWMDVRLPQAVQTSALPAAHSSVPAVESTQAQPAKLDAPQSSVHVQGDAAAQEISILPPTPGGFVQPLYKAPRSSVQQPTEGSATGVEKTPSTQGIVYSGVPVFSMLNASKRIALWMRQKLAGKSKQFDRSTFPVTVLSATGMEKKMPLSFSIGESVSSVDYDRVVFREDPRFENGYIIELHDHGKDPIKMNHFYMALYNQDVGRLTQAAGEAGISVRLKLEHTADVNYETISKSVYRENTEEKLPLEVSVQLGQPLWSREMKQAFSHLLESLGLPGTYSPNMLVDAKLVLRNNGEIWMQPKGETQLFPLPEGYYVRLPKNQVKNLVKMMPQLEKGEALAIVLSPTSNRVNVVARDASLTNVSPGKTMGSIVKDSLGISESDANATMFTIHYVLPGFASLLTPVLKKYGEKKLLTSSLGMSVAAGTLAVMGGFYGFVEKMTLDPIQKGLFVGAMLMMSGSAILKQLVSNMLIRANRGEVVLSAPEQKDAKALETQTQESAQGFNLIAKRFKEFFTKKSEVSFKDIALYNLSFVYKNIGTLAFLSAPFLIEYGVKGLTGVDLGIDYSASFPLYTAYSAYVMWKVLRSKLRDAYTAKNLLQSQQMLANMLKTGGEALAVAKVTPAVIDDVARSFKDSLDALAFAHIKLDPSKEKKLLYQDIKENVLAQLQENLVTQHHLAPARAAELVAKVTASIKVQENNIGNMLKMLKAPGVTALASAMTLATIHEFVISSSFSGTMKDLISEGELANFLIASSLYVPFIAGRLGGNWISRRISKDSMYLFCSTLSAIGTGIMATAGSSVPQVITGAVVASLGIGNFFTQMYDYIMTKYPKQNRELSSILALTMGIGGLGAIPAGYIASQTGFGMPLNLLYAGASLAVSLVLTPGMFMNSSFIKGLQGVVQKPWQQLKDYIKKLFRQGEDEPPLVQNSAH